MLAYLLVLFSLAVIFSALIGAIVWTIKLGISPVPPEEVVPFSSFRIFPWATAGR
jgi:hypothetical protein